VEDPWRTKLLDALNNLTPSKFEFFCRALVKKMNVDIDETIGVKQSGDGGLDGFGYMMADDFRTSSVAIQAKRWSKNLVSSPEIDKFRGAMDKYRADYGIFITTSSFSKEAVKAARTGTKIITLIDGERLVDLVAKYELYVTPVVTYELGEFFTEDN
jgi:restriction system protein